MDELADELKFETKTIEFKTILNDGLDSLAWVKTVAAFANGEGGDLCVGIDDEGRKKGLPKDLVDRQVQLFHRNVKDHLSPLPECSFFYYEVSPGVYVIRIHVAGFAGAPVLCTYEGVPSIYVREEARTRPATANEIIRLVLSTRSNRFDSESTGTPFSSSDFHILFDTYERQNGSPLTEKKLHSCGFLLSDGTLSRGATLFADAYDGEDTAIKVTEWEGTDKESGKFRSVLDIRKNILSSIDEAREAVLSRIGSSETKTDFGRKVLPDYPSRSLFEGLVNAYAHRDYFYSASIIEVDLFHDRIEITSPGGMASRIDLSHEKDIASIKPTRRNEVIAGVLGLCRYMEREGSGFDRISSDYSGQDELHLPFVNSRDSFFTLVLPNLNYRPGVGAENPPIDFATASLYSSRQKEVLSYCYTRWRTMEEIASHLEVSVSTYLRKDIVLPMVKAGLLIRNESRKADMFRTNREAVSLL